jgi:hypothetical protein
MLKISRVNALRVTTLFIDFTFRIDRYALEKGGCGQSFRIFVASDDFKGMTYLLLVQLFVDLPRFQQAYFCIFVV